MTKFLLGGLALLAALGVAAPVRADAPYCREYQQKVTIGGVVRQTYGTACMQPDGSWQKVDNVGGGDADMVADDVAQDLQVATVQQPVYVQNVVYEEPLYYPAYRPYRYYAGPSVGLSFGFNDHGGRGWGHGGGHGWHGRH